MLARFGRQLCSRGGRFAPLQPSAGVAVLRHIQPLPLPAHASFCSGAAEDTEDELQGKIAEVKEQIEELKNKISLAKDDALQAQKRHGTELQNESNYAISKFAKEVIKVADNLERASSSVKPEDLEQDVDLRKMHAGVTHMQKVLREAMKEFGVVEMEAMDQKFNPDQHEAMFAMPMPGKDLNIVFHVMEPGYMIRERTLRAAKVGVTRAS